MEVSGSSTWTLKGNYSDDDNYTNDIGGFVFNVATFDLQSGSSIDGDGYGYLGGFNAGTGGSEDGFGSGGGAGAPGLSGQGGGGGGYGGVGASGQNGGPSGGSSYGDLLIQSI